MKMKKITKLLAIPFLLASFLAVPAFAVNPVQGTCTGSASGSAICDANKGTGLLGNGGILTKVAQTLVYFAGVVSAISVIIAGFKYVTSQGDPGGIQSAKNTLMYALVGVIIAIFAQTIVTFVLRKL